AVGTELRQPLVDERSLRAHGVRGLVRDRLERRTREVRAGAASRQPDDRPPGIGIPVRRAEAGQGWYEEDAVVGGKRSGESLRLRRAADDPEPVAQPLDGGAGHEDARLERVVE